MQAVRALVVDVEVVDRQDRPGLKVRQVRVVLPAHPARRELEAAEALAKAMATTATATIPPIMTRPIPAMGVAMVTAIMATALNEELRP